MIPEVLKLGERITLLPVIHASGDVALEVRRLMLAQSFDALAVPLPPSFQGSVEAAIAELPAPALVGQMEPPSFVSADYDYLEEEEEEEEEADEPSMSFVPIDPCQPVIAALRVAIEERIPRAFIDLETARFRPVSAALPDPYALKKVSIERFAAAVLPSLARPPEGQPSDRVLHMAARLRDLERKRKAVLAICSLLDWPWLREAYREKLACRAQDENVEPCETYSPDPRTLLFLLGELPFVTALYERARSELEDDENLSVDGVKELLLAARSAYRADLKKRARPIAPAMLAQCLKYIRNLSLIDRRLTPDLYTLVTAASQIAGDPFALHVAETAREYAPQESFGDIGAAHHPTIVLGVDRGRLPSGDTVRLVSRLPGPPIVWRSRQLRRRPERREQDRWKMRWNPFSQCSWPPEDVAIENFRAHVFDRAKAILGADLARTEKFTTSFQDGVDVRETLRHWYGGEIHVKVLPPARGFLDAVVMLFDSPADPRDYPWRSTWFAEHNEESTLAFYATDFRQEPVGPGICQATYGGAMFLFPPVAIRDIWTDKRLDFAETLEERLLAAACQHSQSPRVALLSQYPPGAGWRKLARRFKKQFVHVPLAHFSQTTVAQLRQLHVLNGHEVRSYAADFIRKA